MGPFGCFFSSLCLAGLQDRTFQHNSNSAFRTPTPLYAGKPGPHQLLCSLAALLGSFFFWTADGAGYVFTF